MWQAAARQCAGSAGMDVSRAKKIVIVSGVLTITGLGALLFGTDLGRAMRGISTFAVRNASGKPVLDVRLELTYGTDTSTQKSWAVLEPDERGDVGVGTSDLHLRRLTFTLDGVPREYGQGELATTGEVVVLVIQSDGSVRSRHEW